MVRPNSVDAQRRKDLVGKPTQIRVDGVSHLQDIENMERAQPAGHISAFTAHRSAQETSRFHMWEQVEQQFEQFEKEFVKQFPSSEKATTPQVPGPGDLFGRSQKAEACSLEIAPEQSRENRGSGNRHQTGMLANGVSEAETQRTPRTFSPGRAALETNRFEGTNPSGRQAFAAKEASVQARDGCRFHQHERPARRASSQDTGRDARRAEFRQVNGGEAAGVRTEDHGQRRVGMRHGRAQTPDYHQRYATIAAGSTLPGGTGAAAESYAGNPLTPRGAGTTAGARRIGACDPRSKELTVSNRASADCRFHAENAQQIARQRQGVQRWSSHAQALSSSPKSTPRGAVLTDQRRPVTAPAQANSNTCGGQAEGQRTPYMPGRVDQRPLQRAPRNLNDSVYEGGGARTAPTATGGGERGPLLSLGGGGMTMKRRPDEGAVPAARQRSSPIACDGGIWS